MASFLSRSNYTDYFEVSIHTAKCVLSTLEERKPRPLFFQITEYSLQNVDSDRVTKQKARNWNLNQY